MNEMTVGVRLVWMQSRDPACLAMLSPKRGIDPIVGVERGNDDIGYAGVAFGMTRFARELNAKPPKLRRKRCIQDRFGTCGLHVGIVPCVWA
jgi:hypothetical protein